MTKLRINNQSSPIGVNESRTGINGFVVAEEGEIRGHGGEFDRKALRSIVGLMKMQPKGLKSHFTHPSLSADGLSRILGRAKNPRMTTGVVERDGEFREVAMVRADLHFNPTALKEPVDGGRPMGEFLMELADTDPDAFGSSLVLEYEEELRLNSDGTVQRDEDGRELRPLWRPTRLFSTDIVSDGAAVTAFLSADMFTNLKVDDDFVRAAAPLAMQFLSGKPRDVVEPKLQAFLKRLMDLRYECDDEGGDEVTEGVETAVPVVTAGDIRRRRELRRRKAVA